MIAVDSNILVYAHREEMSQYVDACRALEGLVAGAAPWAIPWPCIHEFLGVTTNPKIFRPPTPVERSFLAIENLLAGGDLVLLSEGENHWERLRDLVLKSGVVGPTIHDARIAAICLSHGVTELWTADRDFSRFPALRVRNPLASRFRG